MVVLFIILFLPRLMERIKLPGLVGLIIGGLILGPRGLKFITAGDNTVKLLADVGKLMVMFFAGMEIDIRQFSRSGHKSLLYGFSTFLLPLSLGLLVARLFGNSWNAGVLIGSLLASHTLLALPMLIRHRLVQRESVTITIGATMFTDVLALIVLAVCTTIHTVGFSGPVLVVRLGGIIVFLPVILLGARWLVPRFLKRMGDENDKQALYVILLMTIAAVLAEAIHLEGIVGAFIIGLAVGDAVREGPVRDRLDTLGNALFVPLFFLTVGSLIDPLSFLRMSWYDIVFMLFIVGGLFLAKYFASLLSGRVLRYGRKDIMIMWSLSIPQVAATLAAALVAFESVNSVGERLITETTLDAVLVLVMITSILGPILTQHFIGKLKMPASSKL